MVPENLSRCVLTRISCAVEWRQGRAPNRPTPNRERPSRVTKSTETPNSGAIGRRMISSCDFHGRVLASTGAHCPKPTEAAELKPHPPRHLDGVQSDLPGSRRPPSSAGAATRNYCNSSGAATYSAATALFPALRGARRPVRLRLTKCDFHCVGLEQGAEQLSISPARAMRVK
jgi:hypothetical protein